MKARLKAQSPFTAPIADSSTAAPVDPSTAAPETDTASSTGALKATDTIREDQLAPLPHRAPTGPVPTQNPVRPHGIAHSMPVDSHMLMHGGSGGAGPSPNAERTTAQSFVAPPTLELLQNQTRSVKIGVQLYSGRGFSTFRLQSKYGQSRGAVDASGRAMRVVRCKYVVDIQKIVGEMFPFMDLCAQIIAQLDLLDSTSVHAIPQC